MFSAELNVGAQWPTWAPTLYDYQRLFKLYSLP
jgi:hypothetical protein